MLQKNNHRRMLRFVFVAFFMLSSTLPFFSSAYASASFGQKFYEKQYPISSGVTLKKENYEGNNMRRAINYLVVDYNHPNVAIDVALSNPLNSLTRITDLAKRENREGHYVVGTINASYFETNGSMFPANLLVKDNQILHFGRNSPNADGPNFYNHAFGISQDGKPVISSFNPTMHVDFHGSLIPIASINMSRENSQMTMYTPNHRYPTVAENPTPYSTEIVVTDVNIDMKNLQFGDVVTGTVSEVYRFGETTNAIIPENGFVLSANGKALADQLSSLQVGDQVTVTIDIDELWKSTKYLLATGPTLIRDGKVSISMNTSSSFASQRAPRTAVGITKDQKLILLTIDGRQSGYSTGASIKELADYMLQLGVVEAINFDGGGSTAIAARLKGLDQSYLINRPSDGQERRVSNAIQIISTEAPTQVTVSSLELENFANLNNWYSASARATAKLSLNGANEPVKTGSRSAKLQYEYAKNEKGTAAAYLVAKQPLLLEGKPKQIGMWVYGDGKEHWLRLQLRDGTSKVHAINFTEENKMNWTGWKYVTADIPQNLTPPYSIERVYVAQTVDAKKGKGTIYFDKLDAIYDTSSVPKPEQPKEPTPQQPTTSTFKDVATNHWAKEGIDLLVKENVITGFPDKTFKPSAQITREQAAVMLARQLKLDTTNPKDPGFVDVKKDSYAYAAIATVAEKGLFVGRKEGYFNPKETMTRAETAVLLQRVYKLSKKGEVKTFSDMPNSHWAYSAVQVLSSNNITTGMPDGTFAPAKPVTRAEFSMFMYRIITK